MDAQTKSDQIQPQVRMKTVIPTVTFDFKHNETLVVEN